MAAHDLDLHPPTTNGRRPCSGEPVEVFFADPDRLKLEFVHRP
jgi:hypothetical protein